MEWEFTEENKERCKGIIAQYPDGHQQAAAIPLLDLGTLTFTSAQATVFISTQRSLRLCHISVFVGLSIAFTLLISFFSIIIPPFHLTDV